METRHRTISKHGQSEYYLKTRRDQRKTNINNDKGQEKKGLILGASVALRECPLCGRHVRDFLKHLAIGHEIENVEQFKQEVEKVESTERGKKAFAEYVNQLKEQRAKGLISAEDYRMAVTKWFEERKNNEDF